MLSHVRERLLCCPIEGEPAVRVECSGRSGDGDGRTLALRERGQLLDELERLVAQDVDGLSCLVQSIDRQSSCPLHELADSSEIASLFEQRVRGIELDG